MHYQRLVKQTRSFPRSLLLGALTAGQGFGQAFKAKAFIKITQRLGLGGVQCNSLQHR